MLAETGVVEAAGRVLAGIGVRDSTGGSSDSIAVSQESSDDVRLLMQGDIMEQTEPEALFQNKWMQWVKCAPWSR